MIPKQDRQGVRKASELEQKYALGHEETAMGVAAEARTSANRALIVADEVRASVAALDSKLNQEELISRLTNDTGVIVSADGTVQIDLAGNKITVNTTIDEASGILELSAAGLIGYVVEEGVTTPVLTIDPSGKINGKAISWKENADGTFTLIGT